MSRKTITFVHTSHTLTPVFEQLCAAKKLDANLVHIEDSSLISDVIADGQLTDATAERVFRHLQEAEESIADYIMVTCSSLGPAVDRAQPQLHKPVLRVDQPLAEQAVKMGKNIGVVATLSTTLNPTADLIKLQAEKVGKEVNILSRLCDGAFDCYANGDMEKHDAAVRQAILELAKNVDVIVLAQASMSRVVSELPEGEITVPVLSSPSLAVDFLATMV